jgi:HSP20 family protein
MNDPRPERSGSVEKLRQEFDKWLETAWSQGEKAMDVIGIRRSNTPAVDVVETPDSVLILVDLPGLTSDQIELSLVGHMLSIQGKYPELESGQVHIHERAHGPYKRSIPLPSSVDAETILADTKNGVLRVVVQKVPAQKARKISITG